MRSVGDLILAGFSQLKNARIENLASDPVTPQSGQIWYNTTDGVYRGFNGTAVITFATGGSTAVLLNEIDAIEAAVGLASDGTMAAITGSNYLGSATTVVGAAVALDAAIKTNADGLASEVTRATGAEGTLTTNLAAEVTRATGAEGTLTTNLAAEVTRATGVEAQLQTDLTAEVTAARAAEGTLTTNLAAEVTRATGAEGTLTTNLAAEVTRATGVEAGLETRLAGVEGSYIKKDGTVAFTGDQSLNSHKLTNVATPADNGDAANKAYVDGKIGALGNAFEYVGSVDGGADSASAVDISLQTIVHAGAYYKVGVSGYFKVGVGAPFYVNMNDGLVFNVASGVDIVDNTNSQVQGTTNFITVSGSSDLGYTVDLAQNAKDRVSTLETGLSAEVTRATGAEGTLTTNLAAEVTRATAAEGTLTTNLAAEVTRATGVEAQLQTDLTAEVTRATGAEGTLTTNLAAEVTRATAAEGTLTTNLAAEVTRATGVEAGLQTEVDAVETAVGLAADGTMAAITGSNYLGSATTVLGAAVALDTALKALSDNVGASSYLYDGSVAATTHTVVHALGQKYCQVIVVDSADKVILADSITFNGTNQLTVEFSSAITCKVLVTR